MPQKINKFSHQKNRRHKEGSNGIFRPENAATKIKISKYALKNRIQETKTKPLVN
jgi:hypothetical protein